MITIPNNPDAQQVLDLALPDNNSGATTVRGFLIELLRLLWACADQFDCSRPFGNSAWPYEVYEPLVRAGLVPGHVTDTGEVVVDIERADDLIDDAICALGGAA